MQTACSSTSMIPRIIYLIFAGYMVINGNLTIGVLISVFDLINFIISPTVYLPFMLNGLNRSIASVNRVVKLEALTQAENVETAAYCEIPSVKVNNLSFSYVDNSPIIKDFSFNHNGYGTVAVCGKSGSRKTTLLDLLYRHSVPL